MSIRFQRYFTKEQCWKGNDQNCANLTIESFMKVTFSYTNLSELRLSKIFSMGLPNLPSEVSFITRRIVYPVYHVIHPFFIKLARSTEHGWMTDALVSQYHNDHSLNCWNPGIIDVLGKRVSRIENLIQKLQNDSGNILRSIEPHSILTHFLKFRWCFFWKK